MSWTDDRVELLTKLWGEGKTAAEIAKELGGVTRNAVIGKAHRLKLSNRVSPIQQNNKKPAPKPAAPVKKSKQIVAEDEGREKFALTDLGPRQCRWPIGDPRDANFGFCGCESISGLPYCSEHAQVAYQAATRNRILKAAEASASAVKEIEAQVAKKKVANS